MRTLLFEVVGSTLVSVTGKYPVTDPEWDECIECMKKRNFRSKYVWSAGGTISSSQRLRTREALNDQSEPVALVTDQLAVRAAVGIMNLFFKNMKAFSTAHEAEAMNWLEIPDAERPLVSGTVLRMRKELGV